MYICVAYNFSDKELCCTSFISYKDLNWYN